ncbi:MAG: hypothetical protein ABIN08_14660 [Caldimonas sp.]
MRRTQVALLALLSMLLLPGCASRIEMPLNVAMFPKSAVAPDVRVPGRVAVVLPPTVKDQVHEADDGPARGTRVSIGSIVGSAMLASAADTFVGGAERLELPNGAGTSVVATLVVQSVRISYHRRLLWFIPLPIVFVGAVGDFEFAAHLALDVTVLDPQGQVVWTRSYDDGRQVWPHEWTEQGKALDGLLRVTHEAAWRQSQQAVRELREWVEGERMRPRSL